MTEALKQHDADDVFTQLAALPDHLRGEILGGELVVSPRPTIPHANAESGAGTELRSHFHRKHGDGGNPGGWWILHEPELLLGDDLLAPDIAGWKRERMPVLPRTARLTLAPDWVCEVLSPRTARFDRNEKATRYHQAGVGWRWLIDPDLQTLEAYRREGAFWVLLGVWSGDVKVRVEPFDAVELDMSGWWEGVEPLPD